jgi:hypothetical protein
MRLFFAAFYCVILTVLVIVNASRSPPAPSVAITALQANQLVQASDLRPQASTGESVIGQYVRVAIPAGAPVVPDNVSPLPTLAASQGHVGVMLPAVASLVRDRRLNAGTKVRVCKGGKDALDAAAFNASAAAVLCPQELSSECVVLIELTPSQVAMLAAASASAPMPHVRPRSGTCE